MKKIVIPIISVVIVIFAAKFLVFKGGAPQGMHGEMPPPMVETTKLAEINVTDKIEATGRVESKDSVDIIARVDGFLQKAYFKEGSYVKKGELLFLIEPDRYQISDTQARADIDQTKATLNEAEKNLVRIKELVDKDYASKAQYDQALAQRDQARAFLGVKQASLSQARLNLSYTRIYAPVSGKIGKIYIDQGNVVSPMTGPIAKIVSINPIYVNYSINSSEYLKLIKNKNTDIAGNAEIKLPDNTIYPKKGEVVFFDNEVNSTTGTINVRAEFQNPDNILVPGQYLSVIMYVGKPRKTLDIPQEAILSSVDGKYVYLLTKDNTVKPTPLQYLKGRRCRGQERRTETPSRYEGKCS